MGQSVARRDKMLEFLLCYCQKQTTGASWNCGDELHSENKNNALTVPGFSGNFSHVFLLPSVA